MKTILTSSALCVLLTLIGCSKQDKSGGKISPSLREALMEVAKQQSAAFTNGTCTIRQAYRYTGTLPFSDRGTNAFLALVVEVSGYGEHFDFDDIDLIDADSNENLGSDPGIWPLRADGMAETGDQDFPAAPGPATVFLLYERERVPKRIKLGYWGAEIVKQGIEVAADGRDVFKPK